MKLTGIFFFFSALCHHFNLYPTVPESPDAIGSTFNMQVSRDAHMPSHVLAVTSPDQNPSIPPVMIPIDITLFEQGFRLELDLPLPPPGSTAPIPHTLTQGDSQILMVALPVHSLVVPHVTSLPLILLFGMRLETQLNLLAWSLLPVNVVEEFPNASLMALILSRVPDDQFGRIYRHNHGIWKNTLALGFTDSKIDDVVHTAWNVTAEARRLRQRAARQ